MISVNTKQAMNLIALTETSFESLYYEYSGRMCNYAKHFLQDEYSAEELVQETFIRLWEKYQGQGVFNLAFSAVHHAQEWVC